LENYISPQSTAGKKQLTHFCLLKSGDFSHQATLVALLGLKHLKFSLEWL
jgi:hypothetical protein